MVRFSNCLVIVSYHVNTVVVEWRDENQNPIEDPSKHVLSTREKQVRFCDQESDEAYQNLEVCGVWSLLKAAHLQTVSKIGSYRFYTFQN